jgi:hypothetical protein
MSKQKYLDEWEELKEKHKIIHISAPILNNNGTLSSRMYVYTEEELEQAKNDKRKKEEKTPQEPTA